MTKVVFCLPLLLSTCLLSACISPSGLGSTVPNPEDPKYNSPNCRAIRAMAAEYDFRSYSRTGLALAAEGSHKKLKELPSSSAVAKQQERGPMIAEGVEALCTS
ncbi:hypothetical protein [Aquidulcibacter sp.]|uniref:hypothetical protein n=1 Tax=Aquidulcibacter sp. TaxID=2052990 RepID=UPI0025C34C48|nr:hypothetical protein [Aquidulcibacter sp.]MCA3694963.1 hypothetical protein [Aquidulcibacter sp.]